MAPVAQRIEQIGSNDKVGGPIPSRRARIFFLVLCILTFLGVPHLVFAKYDPMRVANNKFGIHIVDPNDISDAAALVNSSGGDWGYVTLVIQEDDRDIGKWQRVFDEMRKWHLIPIVRLATHVVGDSWVIPTNESARDWATFLNALNWPIENRYVIIFNEPNHAKEWGGSLNPEGYADTLVTFTDTLRQENGDFFVLPAGLDVSASSDGLALDAREYLQRMVAHKSDVFERIDGWTSHSYPNPAFSGSPYQMGRGTLTSYQWERSLLSSLGIKRDLPVFITETGWIHSQGMSLNTALLSPQQVANNILIAADSAWKSPQVVAVTPFVLNYQGMPFDHFSWRKLGSHEFYAHYSAYQSLPKQAGKPKQREQFSFTSRLIPKQLVSGSHYSLFSTIHNTGQSILSETDGYRLSVTFNGKFTSVSDPLPLVEPNQRGIVTIHVETPMTEAPYTYMVQLVHDDISIPIETGTTQIIPPPSVSAHITLLLNTHASAHDVTMLVYDSTSLIHKVNGVRLDTGTATIGGLRNVVPGSWYRIVVLVPYYLPRQAIVQLGNLTTTVEIPRMYPLDFNKDGKLSFADLSAALSMKPNTIIPLFLGP